MSVITNTLAVLATLAPALAAVQVPRQAERIWREPMACGANCVFLLTSISGADLSYDDVLQRVAIDENGTSLHELESSCQSLDIDYKAVRGRPEILQSCDMPIVVHLDHWTGRIDQTGHFVLLTSYDEDANLVQFLDPITVLPHRVSVDTFRRSWSGYALVPRRAGGWPSWLASFAFAFLGALLLTAMLTKWSRRIHRVELQPLPEPA